MKINKIDHIGVAVSNLTEVKETFTKLFDLNLHFEEEVKAQLVKTIGFDINGTNIEFLEPSNQDSVIQKYIDKRKNAVHHIAFQVDDLDTALSELKDKNVTLIDQNPRIGAEGKRIAFIHPKSTSGILIELSEKLND
jgi:methylmalonyl-CoA epimerase